MTEEAVDGLCWAEGADFGPQRRHLRREPLPGVERSAQCLPGWRTLRPTRGGAACGGPHPTAVLHMKAGVLAEHSKQFPSGTQAGQQIPALPANLPWLYPPSLSQRETPNGCSQGIISPDSPLLDHTRFFSRVSASDSPSSSGQTHRLMPPEPRAGFP